MGVGTHDIRLTPLLCKRWRCETCLPHRLKQLRALAASGNPTSFVTLTIDPKRYDSTAAAAQDLVRCWRLIRQRLVRDGYCKKSPFLAVIEATAKGWPHLHILCRLPYVPQRYLSALAQKYTGSPIVDIRKVYNRRHASRYIAKYVSKGPAQFEGCKRYWRSQDYAAGWDPDAPVADRGRRWFKEREHIDYIVWTLAECDWHQSGEGGRSVTLSPGPGAGWLWPFERPPDDSQVKQCRPSFLP